MASYVSGRSFGHFLHFQKCLIFLNPCVKNLHQKFGRCIKVVCKNDLLRFHEVVAGNSLNITPICKYTASVENEDTSTVKNSSEEETLHRAIDILVKGHELSVLDSYVTFMKTTAKHLDIDVAGVLHPKFIADRMTLLKSVHIYKKHRVQYETRTHRQVLQLKYLTGSTAKVYLEYIQRNLPAGVVMHVHKWEINRIPAHIREEMMKNLPKMTDADWEKTSEFVSKIKMAKKTTAKDYEEYHTTKRFLVGTVM